MKLFLKNLQCKKWPIQIQKAQYILCLFLQLQRYQKVFSLFFFFLYISHGFLSLITYIYLQYQLACGKEKNSKFILFFLSIYSFKASTRLQGGIKNEQLLKEYIQIGFKFKSYIYFRQDLVFVWFKSLYSSFPYHTSSFKIV